MNRFDLATQKKPKQGKPCNGCGLCCLAQVCDLGLALGDDQHCKALIHEGQGKFSCGLVSAPYRYLPAESIEGWLAIDRLSPGAGESALKAMNAQALGAGKGCDSDDDEIAAFITESQQYEQLPLILKFS
jgi:hypothetical protein